MAGNLYGLFGGAFDPIHYGHLRPLREVLRAAELAEIAYIPAARPPHRAPAAAAPHRLAMTQIAVADEPNFTADAIELNRPGISYTADTVAELQNQHPRRKYVWIMGADALAEFHAWHRAAELQNRLHIIALARPGFAAPDRWRGAVAHSAEELRAAAGGKLWLLPTAPVDISATALRARLACGDSVAEFTPPAVCDYIGAHNLYRNDAPSDAT